eukprot:ctg_434.g227
MVSCGRHERLGAPSASAIPSGTSRQPPPPPFCPSLAPRCDRAAPCRRNEPASRPQPQRLHRLPQSAASSSGCASTPRSPARWIRPTWSRTSGSAWNPTWKTRGRFAASPSISAHNIPQRTACCGWCCNWTAKCRVHRSARRPAAPRHREANGVQDVSAGAAIHGPAGLLLHPVQRAGVQLGGGESAQGGGAAARQVHPHHDGGDHSHLQPPAGGGHARHGRGRADALFHGVRGAREDVRVFRARQRRPHARQLHPAGRRASGPAAGHVR